MDYKDLLNLATPQGLEIVSLGHPCLRLPSAAVELPSLNEPPMRNFLQEMVNTLNTSKGVGLAAPQVGVNLRIFLTRLPEGINRRYVRSTPDPLRIWINPSWRVDDPELLGGMEGCLSIPHYMGRVLRPARINVSAFDHLGQPVTETLDGWNARVFLHEYDHIEGELYIDKIAKDLKGHPELYESSTWRRIESQRRAEEDELWLRERGINS